MKKKYKKFGHKATICSKKKKKPTMVIYDGLNGIIINKPPNFAFQADLAGAKVRLCIGTDNTVIVRSITILREVDAFEGGKCIAPIEPKKIKIIPNKVISNKLSIRSIDNARID